MIHINEWEESYGLAIPGSKMLKQGGKVLGSHTFASSG